MSIADVLSGRSAWACHAGESLAWLRTLPSDRVHSCVTSPPYYGLRDYGTGEWVGGDPACDHKRSTSMRDGRNESRPMLGDSLASNAGQLRHAAKVGCRCGAIREDRQIGLEESPAEYVAKLVDVFREVRRVLHPTGVMWLNLGDSYANDAKSGTGTPGPGLEGRPNLEGVQKSWRSSGLKKKDLIGIPWMVAFALREDGWYLRGECVWHKPNAMTESMMDRPGRSHETVFLLSKGPRPYFDRLAVPGSQLLRTVWSIPVARYKGAHFATFPARLAERCIITGTSERGVCPACGNPWVRDVERVRTPSRPGKEVKGLAHSDGDTRTAGVKGWNRPNVIGNRDPKRHTTKCVTRRWLPSCECNAGDPIPALVLDPFAGSGTTLAVGVGLGRRALGCELNPDYVSLVEKRMRAVTPSLCG